MLAHTAVKRTVMMVAAVALCFLAAPSFAVSAQGAKLSGGTIKLPREVKLPPHPDNCLSLCHRTFQMVSGMAAGAGLGQCWPGISTWRKSMEKYQTFSRAVDVLDLAADKKKHAKACAKISSVIKGITGSSLLAYTVTMQIGVAKEIFDGFVHWLTGKGHKEYLDLEADHVGARIVYQDIPSSNLNDVSVAFRECERLWNEYSQLVDEGRYQEAEAVYRQWYVTRKRFDVLERLQPPADELPPDPVSPSCPVRYSSECSKVKEQYEAWHRKYLELLQAGHPINSPEVKVALERYRYWRNIYQDYRSR